MGAALTLTVFLGKWCDNDGRKLKSSEWDLP